MNTQLLVETQAGKKLRKLTKHQDLNIKGNAAELLNVWKSIVSSEAAAVEKGKEELGDFITSKSYCVTSPHLSKMAFP